MIGIMNVGSDSSVEFYASPRASSLYQRKPSKGSRTYTPDGRVLINGVPEVQDSPDELWRNLIYKAVATRAVRDVETKENGPLAVIRRFSSRLRLRQKPSVVQSTIPEEQQEKQEEEKPDREHVTIIRIKTVQKKPEEKSSEDASSQVDDDGDELRIYAQESILKRLMEEKAMIEGKMGNISMEWGSDSGRTSIDEESDIIVERF